MTGKDGKGKAKVEPCWFSQKQKMVAKMDNTAQDTIEFCSQKRRDVTSLAAQSRWLENVTSLKRTTRHQKEPQKVTKEKQMKESPKEVNQEIPVKGSHK